MPTALRILTCAAADAFKLIAPSVDPALFTGHVETATIEQLTALRGALAEVGRGGGERMMGLPLPISDARALVGGELTRRAGSVA